MSNFSYSDQARVLQKRFDTTALADAELQVIVHDTLTEADRGFIQSMEMFWLASVDDKGNPTVSYKGGSPGFVNMPNDKTIQFPCFDGNGMFWSMGNIATTSHVGLLFMDFIKPFRLRVQGEAKLTDDPSIVSQWAGAQFAVTVNITSIVQNCPRYIPRMQRLEGSRYIPDKSTGSQPIPGWKRIDAIQPVLPKRDQNKAETVGGLITMDQWGQMVADGNPLA